MSVSRNIIFLPLFLMNWFNIIRPLVVLFIVISISACKDLTVKDIDEGVMKYKITYLEDKSKNPLIALLPSHLEMHFKDNSVLLNVKGWMGIFESSFIKNYETGELITTMKMMSRKYYYLNGGEKGYMGDTKYNDIIFEFDDVKKEIIGFDCKHAVATVPAENLTFDLFFTEEIAIEEPNLNTVFEEIPGVLMEFHMDMNGIPMHLIATELNECEVPEFNFAVPKDYERVEKHEIDTILSSLM